MTDKQDEMPPPLQEMLLWLERQGKPDYASAFKQLWYERDTHYQEKVRWAERAKVAEAALASSEEFFGADAAKLWNEAFIALHRFAKADACPLGTDVVAWFRDRTTAFHKAQRHQP